MDFKNVDITKTIKPEFPTAVCFCAGYGGIEKGLESVFGGVSVLALSEIEAYPAANLIAKMEAGEMAPAPLWTDLKTFPSGVFRDRVDVLTGGFPCQPFSAAGARAGDEDPRHLFPYFIRAIREMRPRQVFLENVAGILSAKLKGSHWNDPEGTPVLLHVCRELEREGYRVEVGVFSAEEVGAPHQRKRVFILAELANSESGRTRLQYLRDKAQFPEPRDAGRCTELADSLGEGQQGGKCAGKLTREERSGPFKPTAEQGPSVTKWPNHPGQPQADWEAPRAFTQMATESQLGRTAYGAPRGLDATPERMENRADRLRLCGNGVVPQTAAVAYRVLSTRINMGG